MAPIPSGPPTGWRGVALGEDEDVGAARPLGSRGSQRISSKKRTDMISAPTCSSSGGRTRPRWWTRWRGGAASAPSWRARHCRPWAGSFRVGAARVTARLRAGQGVKLASDACPSCQSDNDDAAEVCFHLSRRPVRGDTGDGDCLALSVVAPWGAVAWAPSTAPTTRCSTTRSRSRSCGRRSRHAGDGGALPVRDQARAQGQPLETSAASTNTARTAGCSTSRWS
jgi:hypothetical protein